MNKESGAGILEEFRIEFWQRLPNKVLFFGLLVAWLALFQFWGNSTLGYVRTHSLLHWMYKAYNPSVPEGQEENDALEALDAHGNLVPFVVLALFWWKRKELLAAELKTWSPALLLVVAGLLIHVLGFAVQQPRISIVGLFTGVYGLMGLAWGPTWLARSFFPFCLFVFSVPLGSLAQPITFRLQLLVSRLVELFCNYILPIGVVRQGTQLFNPTEGYAYEIAAPCSGIRSLIATIGLGIILGFVSFKAWPKRLLMIASAFPLAVLGNFFRMLTIVFTAQFGGQQAGNYVHKGGPGGVLSLLPYIPAFIGLLWLESYLRGPRPAKEAAPAVTSQSGPAPIQNLAPDSPAAEVKQT